MTPQQNQLIDSLVEDFKPEVQRIESSLATTQNHYGDYMGLLSLAKSKTHAVYICEACIRAGANKTGIINAFKILWP